LKEGEEGRGVPHSCRVTTVKTNTPSPYSPKATPPIRKKQCTNTIIAWSKHFYSGAPPLKKNLGASNTTMVEIFPYLFVSGGKIVILV
jgi:hypothetical protein